MMKYLIILLAAAVLVSSAPTLPSPNRAPPETTSTRWNPTSFTTLVTQTFTNASVPTNQPTFDPVNGNFTPHHGLRLQAQAQDKPKFTYTGATYFVPDIEVQCTIFKGKTDTKYIVDFNIVISPAGLAYSQDGLEAWFAHFKKEMSENWSLQGRMNPRVRDDWEFDTWNDDFTNWGWGIVFGGRASEMALFMEDKTPLPDPGHEVDLSSMIVGVIPAVACEKEAESLSWTFKEKCKVHVDEQEEPKEKDDDKNGGSGDEKEDDGDKDDDDKDDDDKDDGKDGRKGEDRGPIRGGGYRGRGG